MTQPTPYERLTSFTDHSTSFPTTPQPGVDLDAEFDAIRVTLEGVLANLALLQRDDGALKNGIVGFDSLSDDLRDYIRNLSSTALPPANTVLPVISGLTVEGQTLTCSTGTWDNDPVDYSYQWARDGVAVTGATASTYVLSSTDIGATMGCTVTANNLAASVPASAVAVGPVEALAFESPADQSILTVGVVNVIETNAPGAVTADGSAIGSTAGDPATLDYTPAAADNDIELATGSDTHKAAAAAADNQSLWDISAWALTNIAVTSGQPDPFGGTTAFKAIAVTGGGSKNYRMSKGATGTPATANSSGELWISPIGTLLPGLRFYPVNAYGEIKPASDEYLANIASIHIVETVLVSGRTWHRVWFRCENGKTLDATLFIDLLGDFLTPNVDIAAGEHGFYICRPRYVDGPLPFYPAQRLSARNSGVVSGVVEWLWRGPFNDGTDLYDGQTDFKIKVLVPATYDSGRAEPYPVVYVQGVEPTPNVLADEMQVIKTAGYHDTYDAIFVEVTTQAFPWGGKAASGKHDHDTIIAECLPQFMADHYHVSDDPEDRLLFGYSKGGWAAYSFLLRHRDVFGYAASWDTPWTWEFSNLDVLAEQPSFETSAQFDAYKPLNLLPSRLTSVNDKKRLVLAGAYTFATEVATMHTVLSNNNVEHDYLTGLGTAHDAQVDWMGPTLAALMALRG